MKRNKLLQGYILVIISAFLFGCMPLITQYIYKSGVNRESIVLVRSLLALPILAFLTWRQDKSLCVPLKALPSIALIALSGCCITPFLLYSSYQYIATGTATVFHFIYPAVVAVLGFVFLGKKINGSTCLAVLICVLGICLFYNPGEPLNWTGCLLALVSGMTYAVYVILLSVFRYQHLSGFKLNFYITVVCVLAMLPVGLIGNKLTFPTTAVGWLWCLLLAIAIGIGAVVLFQRGAMLIGGERASILSAVEPLTGVVVGAIVFDETITVAGGIGSVLVITACVLIALGDAKKQPQEDKATPDV